MDPAHYTPPSDPMNIVYEDDDLLVLNKPSGLLSVPGKSPAMRDCLQSRAEAAYPDALLVHRLDMDTSGIFVMARSKVVQANLGKQFERRKVKKIYSALVSGIPQEKEGLVDLPLRCDWPNRPKQMVCFEHGKPAQTYWKLEDTDQEINIARLSLKPVTGRSHQLRVHMMEVGYPILGDAFYAPKDILNAAPRLCLHAQKLTLHHPQDGRIITFESAAPF